MAGGKHILGKPKSHRIFGTARVGERGQIVIPKEARQFYGIRPGDTVLVLGADGFGRPISVAAHRPALYARLAGVPENRPVTPAIAARVAAWEGFHDQVFVNQVDREDEWPLARQLAEKLDCPVVAGSLRSGYWEKIK